MAPEAADHVRPGPVERCAVVVTGGGAAGENVAGRCADGGLSVVLVEDALVGGECSYWACIPSKALLRPGEALEAARRAPGAREAITDGLDTKRAFARRDELVGDWDDEGQVRWLDEHRVTLVRGRARLAGERVVAIEHPDGQVTRVTADRAVVLATGSVPDPAPITGLDTVEHWDSRAATAASSVPERLVVLGGGPVGVEMAQLWQRFGSQVTLLDHSPRLLDHLDPFVGDALAQALAHEGVEVYAGVSVARVERRGPTGPVTVTLDGGPTVTATELLDATGRRAATDDLGLDAVGLQPGEPVDVDERMRARGVAGDWLYAVGDVNGRAPLTHMGKYQARVAADVILGKDVTAWAGDRIVPSVVFTDPQVAHVGRTAARAREDGLDVRVVRYDLGDLAAANTRGVDVGGTAQIVVDERRRILVGATFVGPDAGELLHAATVAIAGDVTLDVLWHAVPSFPTLSEIWLRLLERYGL